jgi:Tol biopolymer transport system component
VHTDVYLIRADGSGETRLTTTPGDDHAVQFSPDGTRLAFVSDGPPAGLFLVNVDGSGQRLLSQHGGATLAWSPDGRMIASDPGDVWVIDAAGGTSELLVENGKNPVWFPDGGQIGFERSEVIGGHTSGALFRIGVHGSGLTKLTDIPEGVEGNLAWSPNRETIAFAQFLSTGDRPEWELFTMATDGSNLVQLTQSQRARERNPPVWSPDGQKIAAMRLIAGFAVDQITVVNADGTGEVTLNTGPSSHNSFDPAWSPQGNKIAFQRQLIGFPGAPPEPEETWVVNADGTNPIKISDCDGTLDWQP